MSLPIVDSVAEKQAFYDDYWTSRSAKRNVHELTRLGEIMRALALVVASNRQGALEICDLGCGLGWLSSELVSVGRVTGVDLSPLGIEQARKSYPDVEFEVADITDWNTSRQFDLVVSSEVLEHLTQKDRFVDTIKRITRQGSWVLITTPNKKVKGAWDAADMGQQYLEDWVTPKELRSLFSEFTVVHQSTFMYDFAYVGAFRWLSAPKFRKFLQFLKMEPLYDTVRGMAGLGLYQILLCRRA